MKKIWAVDHRLGVSLIEARTGATAIKRAAYLLGATAGPFTIQPNQPQACAWAKAMGAAIL